MRGASPLMLLLVVRRAGAFALRPTAGPRRLGARRLGALRAAAVPVLIPELIVLDLDDCVWSPEMFTLEAMPSDPVRGDLGGRGEGVVGVRSGAETIRVFPGALRALQDVWDGTVASRLAVASSADTPFAAAIARDALQILEVVPGVSVRTVLDRGWPDGFAGHRLIGRTPPLSSDKSRTHFPLLREHTGVAYDAMLFFDDSNWSDHCGIVERNCPGVVAQRTPRGLQYDEFLAGLKKFAAAKEKKGAS
jgi:magnesium-dependent phosphatase 1